MDVFALSPLSLESGLVILYIGARRSKTKLTTGSGHSNTETLEAFNKKSTISVKFCVEFSSGSATVALSYEVEILGTDPLKISSAEGSASGSASLMLLEVVFVARLELSKLVVGDCVDGNVTLVVLVVNVRVAFIVEVVLVAFVVVFKKSGGEMFEKKYVKFRSKVDGVVVGQTCP